jgi:hypothetical protein
MKKITLLIALMITSLGFSQTPEGTWKFIPAAGAFQVGPAQGSNGYYQNNAGDVNTRGCQFDDEFVFNANGTFQNVLQGATWIEGWQGQAEGCGAPIAPHNGSNPATYAYSAANKTIILSGVGAYLGLNKAYNGGELSNPANAPTSITYIVTTLTATNMTLDILVGPAAGGAWWRFNFIKKQAGTPTIGALSFPPSPITVGDAPFELVDPVSDSPGAFTYTSSNTAVATITGATVFIVGAGTTKITANQAAASPFVGGSVNADLFVYATPPTTSAPDQPARNAADVISIFSNAYTNLPGTSIKQEWGQQTIVDDVDPGDGDIYKRMVNFNYQGVVLAGPALNVSVGYKLHIDILHTDLTPIKISLISLGKENPYTITPTSTGWKSYDIDVNATNFPVPVLTEIYQLKLEQSIPDLLITTYWDNLYFYKGALGVSKFDAAGIKMYPNPVKNSLTIEANSSIQRVSVYNVLGQEVMSSSPKSNSTTLQTNELQKGVYMVKTEIDGNVSSSKIVKE